MQQMNARSKFTKLAPILGTTLQMPGPVAAPRGTESCSQTIWHSLQVTALSLTLMGTKPPPESVEGLDVQRDALQHLAAILGSCALTLTVTSLVHACCGPVLLHALPHASTAAGAVLMLDGWLAVWLLLQAQPCSRRAIVLAPLYPSGLHLTPWI